MQEYHIIIETQPKYEAFYSPKKIVDIWLSEDDYNKIKHLIFSSDLTKEITTNTKSKETLNIE